MYVFVTGGQVHTKSVCGRLILSEVLLTIFQFETSIKLHLYPFG